MEIKHQKCPKNRGFPLFVTPKDFFFKNWALSLLYSYGAPTSGKKLEKTNGGSLRYLKTDRGTDGLINRQKDGPMEGRTWVIP